MQFLKINNLNKQRDVESFGFFIYLPIAKMDNPNHREHIGRLNDPSHYPRYYEGVDLDEENILHLSVYEVIKYHRGQYYITEDRRMQIDDNYDDASNKQK